jgi:hypothetical protein
LEVRFGDRPVDFLGALSIGGFSRIFADFVDLLVNFSVDLSVDLSVDIAVDLLVRVSVDCLRRAFDLSVGLD